MGTGPAESQPRRAWRSRRALGLFMTIFAAALAADLLSKSWAFGAMGRRPVDVAAHLAGREALPERTIVLVPRLLALKLTVNRGAVFGIMQGQRWFFIAATAVAIGVIGYFFCASDARQRVVHLAMALILAGALGNLYDRTVYGGVRDLLWLFPGVELPFGWTWPGSGGARGLYPWIFNIADVCLLVGIVLVVIRSMFAGEHEAAEHADSV